MSEISESFDDFFEAGFMFFLPGTVVKAAVEKEDQGSEKEGAE